jgi:hypothetical protein
MAMAKDIITYKRREQARPGLGIKTHREALATLAYNNHIAVSCNLAFASAEDRSW